MMKKDIRQKLRRRVKNTIIILTALFITLGGSNVLFNKNSPNVIPTVHADDNYFALTTINPFTQNWTDTSLITTNNIWSGVPSINGYSPDLSGTTADVDAQTRLADYSSTLNVTANQNNPSTFASGGLAEFEITNPVVAFQGSGTNDAPNLDIRLDTTGCVAPNSVNVSYNARDIDASTDNAAQQVALHYRVGTSGNYTNVPAAYIADATTGPSLATLVTPITVVLPAATLGQPNIHVRMLTTNAAGTDEEVGIDDISITCAVPSAAGAIINGRITDSRGRGLQRVVVMMMGNGIEEPIYATTSAFGYYRFEDIPAGNTYILTASSIRYTFEQPTIVINVNGDLDGADFVGQRRFSGLTNITKEAKP